MLKFFVSVLLSGLSFFSFAQKQLPLSNNKKELLASIAFHEQNLIRLSDSIWSFAETAIKETQSSKILADYAEANGFTVQRAVADMPTAFIASYGSGKPVIAVMGEFDALPALSQKNIPTRDVLKEGAPGHGCGHNMFGPGSLGAALAIKDLIAKGKIKGTVRFYGTPAEENGGGKIYMIRAGLFKDVDVCFDWHPDSEIKSGMQSSQAIIDLMVEFNGKSAHAAYDPWNGRSASDAAELFATGVNYLREHVKPSVRMHYVLKEEGNVPNVVPEKSSVWIWIRDSKRSGMTLVEERVREIAKGAALMAGVDYKIKIQTGDYEILVNETGAGALQKNLELIGPITYTKDEIDFANEIQKNYGLNASGIDGTIKPIEKTKPDPEGGSSDVGDVSWVVPEISLVVTTAPAKSPWHSWVVVACGGMSIGHKGMIFASKAMAFTMLDLFENEKLLSDIKKEFILKKGNEIYKPMIPDGPPTIK
jgi:aminobenzoyl-glutamate utilization protein B